MNKVSLKEKINAFATRRLLDKYARLFYKEFDKKLNISTYLTHNKFLDLMLIELKFQYIIKNNEHIKESDIGYLDRQEIIINEKISWLKNRRVDYTHITQLIAPIVTLLVFLLNSTNTGAAATMNFSMSLVTKSVSDIGQLKKINSILAEYTEAITNNTVNVVFGLIISLVAMQSFFKLISRIDKERDNTRIEFNKMCLSVLKQIKNNK